MLDSKRIGEAENNVRSYLQEGLLKKTDQNEQILNVFLQNGKESLTVADEIYNQNLSDLWVIVCSYYAMYYYANAALLNFGYKVGEKIVHKVTADSLIAFIRKKLTESLLEEYEEMREEALNLAGARADQLVESFDYERNKRSFIQYQTIATHKRKKATTSITRAKQFTQEIEKMLL